MCMLVASLHPGIGFATHYYYVRKILATVKKGVKRPAGAAVGGGAPPTVAEMVR